MGLAVGIGLVCLAVAVPLAAWLLRGRPGAHDPITGHLLRMQERLDALGASARRLDALGDAVGDLQHLLTVPRLRGALGEQWLEELLRDALPAGRFVLQHRFHSGEVVDAAVRLGDRLAPIDAKFPLEAWKRMLALDGAAADRERRAFARSLKARVDEIAGKYLHPDEGTTDFAFMYVPAEGVYYEAILREDGADGETVLTYARRRRVIPASPNTLFAYLSALAHGFRSLDVTARGREIAEGLEGLRHETIKLTAALETLGRHLGNAQRQHAEAERTVYRALDRVEGLVRADPEG